MATQTTGQIAGGGTRGRASQRGKGVFGNIGPEQVADGLGWFSIALGVAELLAPGGVSRTVGAKTRHGLLIRFLGAREIAAGVMILSGARAAGCWSRVAGDLMDLALLGGDLAHPETDKGRAIASTAAVAGVTVLDALTAWELTQSQSGAYDIRAERAITINKSPDECYRFWRNFENLPRFMLHLQSVRPTGENRSHWIANGPAGKKLEWDAEVTADDPGECIAWHTLEGGDVEHSGSVRFEKAPGDRGTVVRVRLYYTPPAMGTALAIARMLGHDPEAEIAKDLRRYKQLLETGDTITTEGQPAGRASGATWLDNLARR